LIGRAAVRPYFRLPKASVETGATKRGDRQPLDLQPLDLQPLDLLAQILLKIILDIFQILIQALLL